MSSHNAGSQLDLATALDLKSTMESTTVDAGDYLKSLRAFPRYLDNAWHELGDGRGFFGDSSNGEAGMRSMGNVVYAAALLATTDSIASGSGRRDSDQLFARARAGLAYMTAGHVTGLKQCANGRRWGGVWQSSWWTTRMALGARHVWADLTHEERGAVERVVTHEADLHLGRIVPSGLATDTKAEENAWDAEILATASALFPSHPHRALWWEKLCEYAYNTFSVASDRASTAISDGKPIRDWVYTNNLHTDFTLENHGAYHFCYVASPLHSFAWALSALREAGIAPPEALSHHVREVWERVKPTFLSERFAYISGQDWARYTYGEYFIVPALSLIHHLVGDPDARAIEAARFRSLRREQQENEDGSFFGKRFTAPHYRGQPAKYETDCYANIGLAHRLHRLLDPSNPPSAPRTTETPATTHHVSPECGIAYVRTKKMFCSFSWQTLTQPHPIGLFVPLEREDVAEWQPWNLFGRVVLWRERPSAIWIRRMRAVADGFVISGSVIYRNARARILYRQELEYRVDAARSSAKVRSRFIAESKISVQRIEGLRLAMAHDRWSGHDLRVHTRSGVQSYRFDPATRPIWARAGGTPARVVRGALRRLLREGPRHALDGNWVNVQGSLGVIAEGDQPAPFTLYTPASRNLPDGSLHYSLLFCPLTTAPRTFQPDELMLDSAFTLVAGDAETTRRMAEFPT